MSFFSSVSEQEGPIQRTQKPEDIVYDKIMKNSILSQKYSKQDIQLISTWLSNKKLFVDHCLNLKWSETLLQLKNLKDDFEVDEVSFVDLEKELTEKDDSEFSKSIPIKILITENLGELTKSARGIVSPLLYTFNKSLEFGWFHVALVGKFT